jgi:aspartate/methionine/tyrosine aminotransferase
MFSTRTDWDLLTSPLFSLLQLKRSQGEEILDLTESNPTQCGFEQTVADFLGSEALQKSALYEPHPKGLLTARQAVSDWYKRQDIAVDPERIVLTSGTSEAYSFLLRLLCNVGDVVAVPQPGYPLFEYLARLNDVLTRGYRLVYDGEWHIDVSNFDEILSSNADALILVHPNNPTGSFLKKDERERVVAAARARNVPLIVDEVFGAFPFAADERRAGSFAGTDSTLTFTVNGLSKLLGLPQMKLAWIVVSGPETECIKAVQRLEIISDTYLYVGTIVQRSLPHLLNDSKGMTEQILARTRSNYEFLKESCSSGISTTLFRCEGGWNAILRMPANKSDDEWASMFLRNCGVVTHPGHLFDLGTASCLVVSLLTSPVVFSKGIRGILSSID